MLAEKEGSTTYEPRPWPGNPSLNYHTLHVSLILTQPQLVPSPPSLLTPHSSPQIEDHGAHLVQTACYNPEADQRMLELLSVSSVDMNATCRPGHGP